MPRFTVLAAWALVVLATACGSSPRPTLTAHPHAASTTTALPTTTTAPSRAQLSTVAQAAGPRVGVYDSPTATTPTRTLANPQPSGAPLVFLVRETHGDWLQVLLPVRPNGSSGWVKAAEVRLTQHDYRILIELGAHRITVSEGATVIDQEPIGVGTRDTPTPGGLYYTKELLQPPDPSGPYGPYAYGLSGFSDVLPNFAGGEGVIGIHGTNDPSALGHDVSHGCIRMSNAGITKLAHVLPLGVPVEIRA
ncbi:MAG: L,D-transpeptidase [Actinobacteria bacterium]|nr:MAG: L,D-transpeptidase [Actinomycetota bacterium]